MERDAHGERVSCLLDLGDGRVASADSTIFLWDALSGDCLRVLPLHTARVTGLCALDGWNDEPPPQPARKLADASAVTKNFANFISPPASIPC